MKALVILLSTGKGTWRDTYNIINKEEWDKIFVVTNDFGKEKFDNQKNAELIVCDFNQPIEVIRDIIINGLAKKIPDTEIGVSIISGNGKEHIALMSAVLKSGLGPRLIFYDDTENKVKEA